MLSPSSKESSMSSQNNKTRLSSFSFGDSRRPSNALKRVESNHDPVSGAQSGAAPTSTAAAGHSLSSPLSLSDDQQQRLDGDQISLDSAQTVSTSASSRAMPPSVSKTPSGVDMKRKDSLIFERLVQDQLIDSQPIPSSLPRHYSTENFIPASLDLTAQISHDDINQDMVYSPRRSSTANLQAAFASPSYRKMSVSSASLNRPSTRGSFSNLSEQLQSARPGISHASTTSHIPQQQLQQQGQHNPLQPASPLLRQNKSTLSFVSYADMINLEDQELKFPIRRPSISTTMASNPRLSRTSSHSSASFSQRSPSAAQPSQLGAFHNPFASPNTSVSVTPTNSCSPTAGPLSPVMLARGGSGNCKSPGFPQPKKFSVDSPSSDSDADNETTTTSNTSSIGFPGFAPATPGPLKLAGLHRKMSNTRAAVNLSTPSQTSLKIPPGNQTIDDVLVDNQSVATVGSRSDDESIQSYVSASVDPVTKYPSEIKS